MMLWKKTSYNKLVDKVNNIDLFTGFVLKTQYNTEKLNLDKKISHTNGLVKKTDYNAKISEIKGKIPSVSGLTTTSALTAVENKLPNVSNLVKETDYDTGISETENKLTDHNHDNILLLQNLISLQ